jgi:predicted porin
MKKLLLATLLASACGMSYAQSSVSVYGILDQSYYGVNNSSGSATQIQNGISSSGTATSRFGLKGSEDLGGGLKAGFNLESQVSLSSGAVGSSSTGATQATSGTSEVFNRAANLSLSNSLGELKVGRQATPSYDAVVNSDALGINSLGLINNFVSASTLYGTNAITGQNAGTNIGGASANSTIPNLFSNGVSYTTPTISGVNASLFTSAGSGSTTTTNTGAIRDSVVKFSGSGSLTGLDAVAGYGTTNSASGAPALSRSLLGASYTWDKFKFSATKVSLKFTNSVFGTVVGNNTDITTAGVKYQLTAPLSVGVSYTVAQDKSTTANKSSTTGVSANYDLSKRTALYAVAGQTVNSGAALMTPIYGSSAVGTAGVNNIGYATGIRHTF